MGQPTIRQATIGDLPEMLRIIQLSFPSWPRAEIEVPPIDHLTWKLGRDAAADVGDHTVVEIDGRIVASRLRWFGRVKVGDTEYVTENGADLAVDPEYRGRGISRLLAAYRNEQFKRNQHIGFGTPSNSAQVLHINVTPEVLRPLTVWTGHHSARRFARAHHSAGGIRQLLRASGSVIARRRAKRPRPDAGPGTVSVLDRFDARTDQLWQLASAPFEVSTVRTAGYLNWRYRDARGGPTIVLAAIDRDRCLGYAVFRQSGDRATMPDLLVDPAEPGVAGRLLVAGSDRMRERGCTEVTCWLPPGHAYEDALRRSGFIAAATSWYDFANPPFEGPPAIVPTLRNPASRFHITLGDFDFG